MKRWLIALIILATIGCRPWRWTEYYYVNTTDDSLYVEVEGIRPNASPGVMIPRVGSVASREKAAKFGDEVEVDEKIQIVWRVEPSEERHRTELSRQQLGLPSRLSGGRLEFTYVSPGAWNIKYHKNWKPPPSAGH